jgi:hypothetical protein
MVHTLVPIFLLAPCHRNPSPSAATPLSSPPPHRATHPGLSPISLPDGVLREWMASSGLLLGHIRRILHPIGREQRPHLSPISRPTTSRMPLILQRPAFQMCEPQTGMLTQEMGSKLDEYAGA